MSADEKRIAIATACGWNPKPEPRDDKMGWGFSGLFPKWWYVHQLPDYFNDLNAIQSAVAAQNKTFQREFERVLHHYCVLSGKLFCLLTASDWSDIFLQVMEKIAALSPA